MKKVKYRNLWGIFVLILGSIATLFWQVSRVSGRLIAYSQVSTTSLLGITVRVSVSTDGSQAKSDDLPSIISADGQFVVFNSTADNLVENDTNSVRDVFVYDRQTGETTRVSVDSNGTQANNISQRDFSSISADGRYVAFSSSASNLVIGDTNGQQDIFIHDRQTGETTRASVASDGAQGSLQSTHPSISDDGRYVAFHSYSDEFESGDTNHALDVFVHDQQTGETTRVSVNSYGTQGDGNSGGASISGNGQYIVFESGATNLVSNDTNGKSDIFVHDFLSGQTTRVSEASDGAQGNSNSSLPSISSNGRFIAFSSDATNLVDGENHGGDVFVHDRLTHQTTRVSVASDGAFGNGVSDYPDISANGRFISFNSKASNLVSDDTNQQVDVFVHDRLTGKTIRASVSSDGGQCNSASVYSSISEDGQHIAFASRADNLVIDDTNNAYDVFVRSQGGVFDLPVDNPLSFELAINRRENNNDLGLVNSWFDHNQPYPFGSKNGKLSRWDGAVLPTSPLIFGNNSYDGHEGIDFQYRRQDYPDGNQPVYPAAYGTIIYVEDSACNDGQKQCGLYYYGNQVWIDHGGGYVTLYAHLKRIPFHLSLATM